MIYPSLDYDTTTTTTTTTTTSSTSITTATAATATRSGGYGTLFTVLLSDCLPPHLHHRVERLLVCVEGRGRISRTGSDPRH